MVVTYIRKIKSLPLNFVFVKPYAARQLVNSWIIVVQIVSFAVFKKNVVSGSFFQMIW